MKFKTRTKIMMLAASLAAIIGVSAVSFAAWNGKNLVTTASASTGTAYLFGFETEEPELTFTEKLVPYNQEAASVKDGAQKVVSAKVPDYTVFEAYTITLSNVAGKAADDTTDYRIYVLVNNQETASIDATWAPENKGDWKEVTKTAAAEFGFSANSNEEGAVENKGKVTNMYIHVVLVSDNTAQMEKDFKFDVTLKTNSAN